VDAEQAQAADLQSMCPFNAIAFLEDKKVSEIQSGTLPGLRNMAWPLVRPVLSGVALQQRAESCRRLRASSRSERSMMEQNARLGSSPGSGDHAGVASRGR